MAISLPQVRGVSLVAAANVFYGISIVAGVAGIAGIWTWILMTALGQALLVLALVFLRHGRRGLSPRMPTAQVIRIGVLIAAQVGLYLGALAMSDDGAMIVALHLCAPIIYLAADLILRRRRGSLRDAAIAILVIVGIAVATGASLNPSDIGAMALSLLSAGVIALMWLEMARVPYGANRTAVMGWAVLVVAGCFAWAPLVDGGAELGYAGWGWALLMGALIVAPAGFMEWWGVAGAGAMLTSLASLVQLPATALLLFVFRGDPLGITEIIAASAICAAVALELTRPVVPRPSPNDTSHPSTAPTSA